MKDAVEISRLQKRILYWKQVLLVDSAPEVHDELKTLQMLIFKAMLSGISLEALELEASLNSKFEALRLSNSKISKLAIKTEDLKLDLNKFQS